MHARCADYGSFLDLDLDVGDCGKVNFIFDRRMSFVQYFVYEKYLKPVKI